MDHGGRLPRIGLLWRGDRQAGPSSPPADRGLGPLLEAFSALPVVIEPVVYADDAVGQVREQLLALDGVLVWVNPIQDGASRALLDPLLREASSRGVWVSAHPDVILKMGTKQVLFDTRQLGWGSDTAHYRSAADFAHRFPARLSELGRLVVKQGRGNGGNGVWKVELPGGLPAAAGPGTVVRVREARSRGSSSQQMSLAEFMDRCEEYLAWSGCLVDQAFQDRLADGMLRCYFSNDKVVGFCHQWPNGLLGDGAQERTAPATSVMAAPNDPAYQALRLKAETEWVPQMISILGIGPQALPVIWDADFLYGPRSASGEDTYVLCEINVSAVWPFPPMAAATVAAAAFDQVRAAKAAGAH